MKTTEMINRAKNIGGAAIVAISLVGGMAVSTAASADVYIQDQHYSTSYGTLHVPDVQIHLPVVYPVHYGYYW